MHLSWPQSGCSGVPRWREAVGAADVATTAGEAEEAAGLDLAGVAVSSDVAGARGAPPAGDAAQPPRLSSSATAMASRGAVCLREETMPTG